MGNISIISACNNNCSYCFQKEYHKQNKIMPLEEVKKIIDWHDSEGRIGFLGGEPTLHPNIAEMIEYTINAGKKALIMTNLLCENSVIERLSQFKEIRWLINSNYRDELAELFEQNIETLINMRRGENEQISIGSTLTGTFKEDEVYINKQIKFLEKYKEFKLAARLGLSTDFHNGNYQVKDFSESIEYFLDCIENCNLDIPIGFDCGINLCNVNPDTLARLLEKDEVDIKLGCKGPALDVLLDGSVTYCFCCPDDFLKVKSYKYFKNSQECSAWFKKANNLYLLKNGFACRKLHPECNSQICAGICSAQNEYLRKKFNLPLR